MSTSLNNLLNGSSKPSYKDMRPVHTIIFFENSSSSLISELNKELYFHVGNTKFNTGIEIDLLQDYVLISLETFRKYRYADVKKGRTEIRECDYDSTQYKDKAVTEKMKLDRLKYLSLFVAETPQEIEQLIGIFPDLEGVHRDISEYMERPEEVLSMFSEALRILDRNTAELMVDRMKDEMDKLRVLSEEKDAEIDALKKRSEASDKLSAEKDAEIARLKRQLEEQNK